MGAGGGAAVAIIVAAKQKRRQEVIDAFRVSEATSPDRARRIDEIGVAHVTEAEELLQDGVIVAGRRDGTFYLSEPGYIAHRDRRSRASVKVVVIITIASMLIVFGIAAAIRAAGQ
jgi:hypothetical protein